MTAQDSGRTSAEAFHTVTDPEQARLLSDPVGFRFFEPFLACEQSVKAAAAEVGCTLDTMLYRVKTFLKGGLLQVSRLEKRAGRPIKHYRSVHDAYFIPFEVTPYTGLEERLTAHFREREALIVPGIARFLRETGRKGRLVYRRLDDGEVWQESAEGVRATVNLHDAEGYGAYMARYRGPVAEFMDDTLMLSDDEARELLTEIRSVWRRFQHKQRGRNEKPYLFQFAVVPLEP